MTRSSAPSARKRTRIAEGVYEDHHGLAATIKVGTIQREQRFPRGTSLDVLQAWRAHTRAELLEARDERLGEEPDAVAGTFAADVVRYLKSIEHRVSFKADRTHLQAWLPHVKALSRHQLRPAQVQAIITAWEHADVSPGTIRHRVRVLRAIYKRFDRHHARPPLRGVILPKRAKPRPIAVPWQTVIDVSKSLKRGVVGEKAHGPKKTVAPIHYAEPEQSRARFLVLATTGQRPAQVMRAEPDDVDLTRGLWFVRSAKGGDPIALPLDPPMIRAWKLFIKTNAWGPFNTTAFSRLLRRHGWPEGVRPYQLRHTFAIDMILGGADLGDVQAAMGHRQVQTTRDHYASMQLARLRKALKLRRRGALA